MTVSTRYLPFVAFFLACCIVGAVSSCAKRSDFSLLTAEDIAATDTLDFQDIERGEADAVTPPQDAPDVRIVRPEAAPALQSPIDIEVSFEPHGGARIDAATLRVLYERGEFRKDVTDLVRVHGRVSETGFEVRGAGLPAGRHRLIFEITDDNGRLGHSQVDVEVAEAAAR